MLSVVVKCTTCDNTWTATNNGRTGKKYCNNCSRIHKTMDEFYEIVSMNCSRVVGTYVDDITPVEVECCNCSCHWSTTYLDIKKVGWDHDCDISYRRLYEIVKEKGGEIIGKYENNSKTIDVKCGTCHHIWSPRPSSIMSGRWCKYCAHSYRISKSIDRFYDTVYEKGGRVLGTYMGDCIPIDVQCGKCHNIWKIRPNTIKAGHWCSHCHGKKKRSSEDMREKFHKAVEDKGGKVIGEYVNTNIKVTVSCSTCDKEWNVRPSSIIKGHWCGNKRCSTARVMTSLIL